LLGNSLVISRSSTGVYSVGDPPEGVQNTVWNDMANDPYTWGYSSTTISDYWQDANITGMYDALDTQCDSRFPVNDSYIITATISYLPNGLCKLVYGLMFDTSDAQINTGAQSIFDDITTLPPISSLFSMISIFDDLAVDPDTL